MLIGILTAKAYMGLESGCDVFVTVVVIVVVGSCGFKKAKSPFSSLMNRLVAFGTIEEAVEQLPPASILVYNRLQIWYLSLSQQDHS